MNISSETRRHTRFITILVLIGTSLGIVFSSAVIGAFSLKTIVVGGLIGFFISFFCAIGNFGFLQRFRQLPFVAFLFIRATYFTLVASLFLSIRLFLLEDFMGSNTKTLPVFIIAIFLTLILSFIVTLSLMLGRMLGQNVLLNFFTGRYHKPMEEERIFMFLDIVSSTTIAERIGHLKFHMFLDDFFYDITNAILAAGGEIYKYVGDEVIVNWKLSDSAENNRCIQSFFEIKKGIKHKEETYLQKFGFIPQFRAGIHCGKVVVGEMGDFKREIAFLGDTVNTTARIQEATKKYGKDLLISSDMMENLSLPKDFHAEKLGIIKLRGKGNAIGLYSVDLRGKNRK
jgi:adenylate cyclase